MNVDWMTVVTGVGDFMIVGALVVVFKATFGAYWSDLINRLATLVLATALPIIGTIAVGTVQGTAVAWYTLVLAGLNGVIVGGSLLGVNAVYRSRIDADAKNVTWKSPL